MTDQSTVKVYIHEAEPKNYGLHAGVLGPVETLAQSVSAMAPTTSPSLTIPLVFALAGNATWFVYLLATAATFLVGFCVSRFARLSASPGSLYSYTAGTLPAVFGVIAAWALLLAYLATGASVAGGALYYATVLAQQFLHWAPPAIPVLALVCAVAGWIAYRDVKLSAELMLWIEVISVSLILIVLLVLMFHFGLRIDFDQVRLKGAKLSSLGPALVLAMFSFVGFESATTLGAEARNPLADDSPRQCCNAHCWREFSSCCAATPRSSASAAKQANSASRQARSTNWLPGPASLHWESPSILARSSACSPACWPAPRRPHGC